MMRPIVATFIVMSGLCALIPLPLVDTWAERQVRRRMYEALAADRGVELDDAALSILTTDPMNLLGGWLWVAIVWPFRKLLRTVLYFLTIKDAIDGMAAAALRADCFDEALRRGLLPRDAARVRTALDKAMTAAMYSPVSRTLAMQARPEVSPAFGGGSTDTLVSAAAWLHRHAGGALVRTRFVAALAWDDAPPSAEVR